MTSQNQQINTVLEKQLRYGFDAYSGDTDDIVVNIENVKRLFHKISYLYAIATGGYWEAMFDTVQSTALEDEAVAIELYDKDASAIGGIMSCVPALLVVLMKFMKQSKDFDLTDEDLNVLNQLETIRGDFEQSIFVDFMRLTEVVNFPENVIE